MIRVNLIPVKEKKKQREFFIVFCVILVLAVIALGMAWIYGLRKSVENSLKIEISQIEEESKSYQDKINEVKDIQSKEDSLETLKKPIKQISDYQKVVVMALDQIALALPDGVWLTSIDQGRDKEKRKFRILGNAFAYENIESFFKALQKPGSVFKEVVLTIPKSGQFDISVILQDPK
jgi:type IV pilus assembly protein PilN